MVGWAAELRGLRRARWGCRAAPGNTASTGSAAASRQGEPHVMPRAHGMLRPNLFGEAAGAGLFASCLWQAQRWLLQTCCYPSTFESEGLHWWWLEGLVGLVGNRGDVPA